MRFKISKKTIILVTIIVLAILIMVIAFAVRNMEEKPPEEPQNTVVNVTESNLNNIKLVSYDNGDVSMKIPDGWSVEVVSGSNYAIRVYDPQNELFQIMYMYSAGGFLKSKEVKQYYQIYSNISQSGYEKLPVLSPVTVDNFFKTWTTAIGYIKTNMQGYANFNLPFFFNFKVKEQFELGSNIKSELNEKITEGIVRATYTDSLNKDFGEGLFSSVIVDMDTSDTKTPVAVYNLVALTTPKNSMVEWSSILFEVLDSIKFSDKYLASMNENVIDIKEELEHSKTKFKEVWENRDTQEDIATQKEIDRLQGKERVYNIQSGKVYKAPIGWFSSYVGQEYLLISEDMYLKPVSGEIN